MYFLIYGTDTFRSRTHLRALIEHFKKTRDSSGYNVFRLKREEQELNQVREVLRTPPFLADKKLVILENFLNLKKTEAEQLKLEIETALEAVNIIFFENSAGDFSESPLWPTLASAKFTVEFKELNPVEAKNFILKVAAEFEITLNDSIIKNLVENFYKNTWELFNETVKVSAAVAWGSTLSPTQKIIMETTNPIFKLNDAMVLRDHKAALTSLVAVHSSSPDYLTVQTILRNLTSTLGVISFLDHGANQVYIAQKLSMHPFPVKKIAANAKKISTTHLQTQQETLFRILKENMFKDTIPEVDFSL